MVINGSCNPYAAVALSRGRGGKSDIKRTCVRKKTDSPKYDETFYFDVSFQLFG